MLWSVIEPRLWDNVIYSEPSLVDVLQKCQFTWVLWKNRPFHPEQRLLISLMLLHIFSECIHANSSISFPYFHLYSICMEVAWQSYNRGVMLPALAVPIANAFHYLDSQNITETWKSKCCPSKAALSLTAGGHKTLGQVICTASVPEEPESTRLTGDEPSLSIHTAAWAHHLYLHSSSIKLLHSVNYVYYPSYGPIQFYSLLSLQ